MLLYSALPIPCIIHHMINYVVNWYDVRQASPQAAAMKDPGTMSFHRQMILRSVCMVQRFISQLAVFPLLNQFTCHRS